MDLPVKLFYNKSPVNNILQRVPRLNINFSKNHQLISPVTNKMMNPDSSPIDIRKSRQVLLKIKYSRKRVHRKKKRILFYNPCANVKQKSGEEMGYEFKSGGSEIISVEFENTNINRVFFLFTALRLKNTQFIALKGQK